MYSAGCWSYLGLDMAEALGERMGWVGREQAS